MRVIQRLRKTAKIGAESLRPFHRCDAHPAGIPVRRHHHYRLRSRRVSNRRRARGYNRYRPALSAAVSKTMLAYTLKMMLSQQVILVNITIRFTEEELR